MHLHISTPSLKSPLSSIAATFASFCLACTTTSPAAAQGTSPFVPDPISPTGFRALVGSEHFGDGGPKDDTAWAMYVNYLEALRTVQAGDKGAIFPAVFDQKRETDPQMIRRVQSACAHVAGQDEGLINELATLFPDLNVQSVKNRRAIQRAGESIGQAYVMIGGGHLSNVVRRLQLTDEERSKVKPIIERYEAELAQLLKNRLDTARKQTIAVSKALKEAGLLDLAPNASQEERQRWTEVYKDATAKTSVEIQNDQAAIAMLDKNVAEKLLNVLEFLHGREFVYQVFMQTFGEHHSAYLSSAEQIFARGRASKTATPEQHAELQRLHEKFATSTNATFLEMLSDPFNTVVARTPEAKAREDALQGAGQEVYTGISKLGALQNELIVIGAISTEDPFLPQSAEAQAKTEAQRRGIYVAPMWDLNPMNTGSVASLAADLGLDDLGTKLVSVAAERYAAIWQEKIDPGLKQISSLQGGAAQPGDPEASKAVEKRCALVVELRAAAHVVDDQFFSEVSLFIPQELQGRLELLRLRQAMKRDAVGQWDMAISPLLAEDPVDFTEILSTLNLTENERNHANAVLIEEAGRIRSATAERWLRMFDLVARSNVLVEAAFAKQAELAATQKLPDANPDDLKRLSDEMTAAWAEIDSLQWKSARARHDASRVMCEVLDRALEGDALAGARAEATIIFEHRSSMRLRRWDADPSALIDGALRLENLRPDQRQAIEALQVKSRLERAEIARRFGDVRRAPFENPTKIGLVPFLRERDSAQRVVLFDADFQCEDTLANLRKILDPEQEKRLEGLADFEQRIMRTRLSLPRFI